MSINNNIEMFDFEEHNNNDYPSIYSLNPLDDAFIIETSQDYEYLTLSDIESECIPDTTDVMYLSDVSSSNEESFFLELSDEESYNYVSTDDEEFLTYNICDEECKTPIRHITTNDTDVLDAPRKKRIASEPIMMNSVKRRLDL